MSDNSASQRKDSHLDLARKTLAESQNTKRPLEAIELPYCALPELNLDEIDITTRFLSRQLSAPLLITGMTGGTARADKLNAALVEEPSSGFSCRFFWWRFALFLRLDFYDVFLNRIVCLSKRW